MSNDLTQEGQLNKDTDIFLANGEILITDDLTGLDNKLIFREKFEEYLPQMRKGERSVLCVVDIDNFRETNMRFGHSFSDTLLMNVAEGIRRIIGADDIATRMEGDQFAFLLKEISDEEEFQTKLKKLRRIFDDLYVSNPVINSITMSIGYVDVDKADKTLCHVFAKAKHALVNTKMSGVGGLASFDEYRDTYDEAKVEEYCREEENTEEEKVRLDLTEEIAEYTFEILEGIKDLSSALAILMSNIGQGFGLSRVTLRWVQSQQRSFVLAQQWSASVKDRGFMRAQKLSLKEYREFTGLFHKNGVIRVNDFENEHVPEVLRYWVKNTDTRAMLQCGIYEREELVGILTFGDCRKVREWTAKEVKILRMMARVISAHITGNKTREIIENQVEQLTAYDRLTGVYTSEKFRAEAQKLMNRAGAGKKYAIVNADFSNFKYVNDTLGTAVGDEILKDFADYMIRNNPGVLIGAREYADNFYCMAEIEDEETLEHQVRIGNRKFEQMVNMKYKDMKMHLAIGISVFRAGDDIIEAVDRANIARKWGKAEYLYGTFFFKPEMLDNINNQRKVLTDFTPALVAGDICMFLQPQVDVGTGELVGAEALARWQKDGVTILYPDEFIPTLEKSGHIIDLDMYMLHNALKVLARWRDMGKKLVPISVNFSRLHLYAEDFAEQLKNTIDSYQIESKYIDVEITESLFVEEYNRVSKNIDNVRDYGFKVSIDDLGAGYSSLNVLSQVAVDAVKIDKSFLAESANFEASRHIIKYLMALASKLGFETVCEGVESLEQLEFLKETGDCIIQGYYYDKPLPWKEFEKKYILKEKE